MENEVFVIRCEKKRTWTVNGIHEASVDIVLDATRITQSTLIVEPLPHCCLFHYLSTVSTTTREASKRSSSDLDAFCRIFQNEQKPQQETSSHNQAWQNKKKKKKGRKEMTRSRKNMRQSRIHRDEWGLKTRWRWRRPEKDKGKPGLFLQAGQRNTAENNQAQDWRDTGDEIKMQQQQQKKVDKEQKSENTQKQDETVKNKRGKTTYDQNL